MPEKNNLPAESPRKTIVYALLSAFFSTRDVVLLLQAFGNRAQIKETEIEGAAVCLRILKKTMAAINHAVVSHNYKTSGEYSTTPDPTSAADRQKMREKQARRNRPPSSISRLDVSQYLLPEEGGDKTC